MDYIIFLLVALTVSFIYYFLNKIVKSILRRSQERQYQAYYKQQTTNIINSGSSHPFIKSLIKEIEKLSILTVDVNLADRIDVAACLINRSAFEVDEEYIKDSFCILIANNVNLIKKVFTDDLEQLEELLDSYAEDFYNDSLDEKYGHLDSFDDHVEKKMTIWNKKGLTAKINFYEKNMAGVTECIEDILSELQRDIQLSDFSKYIDGLSVRAITTLV